MNWTYFFAAEVLAGGMVGVSLARLDFFGVLTFGMMIDFFEQGLEIC